MQFRIGYCEIQNLLSQKTGKSIPMCYGGPHTLRISYDVNMLFKTSSVGIDINVDRVDNQEIFLSYSGGMGVEFMLKTALGRVKGQPGAEMMELMDGNRLVLHLDKNQQLSQIFERITLRDIFFDDEFVVVDFVTKSV